MKDVAKIFLLLGLGSSPAHATEHGQSDGWQPAPVSSIEQLIPADRLSRIKAALPTVSYAELQSILTSQHTLWYDDDVMTPSYQDSLGANANHSWPDLVAASEQIIGGLFDRSHLRWQFPFATTAGTDDSTNLQVVNFVFLPHVGGEVVTMPIRKVLRNYNRPQWDWVYPSGTVFGEVLFIKDGNNLLPSEVRTRKRFASGWAMNAFRPFPTARSLAEAIKMHREDWSARPNLTTMVRFLEDNTTLIPKTLAASAALAPTFRQEGWIDPLPDFRDPELVRELLTSTTFVASYDVAWKKNGAKIAYAAASTSQLSIVPTYYDAGLLQVTDEACMRCHKEAGRLVSEFYFDLYLYGELWGKDGIFSFHPFDESRYPELRSGPDNRSIDPSLRQMGIFRMANSVEQDGGLTSGDPTSQPEIDGERVLLPNEVSYAQHIKPVLDAHCVECHSNSSIRSPDFSSFPFTSASGAEQSAIVARILARAASDEPSMPPGVRPNLSANEIALIRAWQEDGLQP